MLVGVGRSTRSSPPKGSQSRSSRTVSYRVSVTGGVPLPLVSGTPVFGDGSTWGPDNTIVFPGATGLLRVEWPSRSRAWPPDLLPRNSWRASTRPATSHTSTTQSPSVTGLRLYVRQLGFPTARSTAPTVLFS